MLKTKRMIKVGIVTPNHMVKEVIETLYKLKAIQIEEHSKNDEFDIGHPLSENEELSEQIVKIRSLASNARINLKKEDYNFGIIDSDEIENYLKSTHEAVKNHFEKIEFYKKTLSIYKRKEYVKAFQSMKIESSRTKDKYSNAYIGFTKKEIEKEVKEISETSHVLTKEIDGLKLVIILSPSSKHQELSKLLNKETFLSLDNKEAKKIIPQLECEIKQLNTIEKTQKELTLAEKELNQTLQSVKKNDEELILNANYSLEIALEKCAAPLKFAASKNTQIISGYVPVKRFEEVKKTLEKATENKVHIQEIPIKAHEEAPILMENPKPTNAFHALLDMFTLPGYHEADPTILMAITFPLFFGFMLGDIGYGLVSLIAFSLARMKFKKGFTKKLLNILIISSIATIVFGFVFGEFFGEEVLFGHEIPHLIARAHNINAVLMIALIVGIIHLNLGLIIGFFNLLNHHGLKHAILEKVSWMILQIGAALAYLGFSNMIPVNGYIGLGVILISAIMLYFGEGVKGLLELPAIFSNILSYARLMAVGLASVQLALLVNEMSFEMMHEGGVMIIFAILILLIGHIINLALGLLGPFLHSLRLHYVEFFGKFYTGGGKRFVAFGDKGK